MTRIFEALKKAQARAGALPFPPVESAPLRPAPVTRPAPPGATAAAVATLEPALVPRIEPMPALILSGEVLRQMTALRVGLEAALEGQKTRVVMFLGAMGGEGVSTVAAQFASALSTEARGTSLLLHARPPRGATGRRTQAAPPLSRPQAPAAARARESLPRAAEAPAPGRPAPLSVAVLGGEGARGAHRVPAAMRATLAALAAQFDWVVVDGPPVLEAAESVDLGPLVDGVVLVVRSGHTKRPVALRAAEMLRKSGVRILGSVLNRRHLEIPDFIYRRI